MNHGETDKVVFEGEDFSRTVQTSQPSSASATEWLIKNSDGLVKNEKQAGYILLGFVIVAIIVAGIVLASGGSKEARIEAPSGNKVIYPKDAPPRLEYPI